MPYAIWERGLCNMKVVIPNDKVIDEFNSIISEKIEFIRDCLFENLALTSLRDTLLPKLMSGEIRVPYEESTNGE